MKKKYICIFVLFESTLRRKFTARAVYKTKSRRFQVNYPKVRYVPIGRSAGRKEEATAAPVSVFTLERDCCPGSISRFVLASRHRETEQERKRKSERTREFDPKRQPSVPRGRANFRWRVQWALQQSESLRRLQGGRRRGFCGPKVNILGRKCPSDRHLR